jgi:peptidoglycan/xylan/chitin deacetylase (PgdA/CDA1 family)
LDGVTHWPALLRGTAALHALAAAGSLVWPDRWPWFAGTLVANHSTLVAAGLLPRCGWLGPNLTRLPAANVARREVGLTFDDGPDLRTTPEILEMLEARGARATFFVVGNRVAAARGLVAEAAARGHRVENHSFRHSPAFFFHPPWTLRDELARCQEAVAEATGRAPVWFRAPAGFRGPLLQPALAAERLALASWTRRGFDAFERDPGKVLARLTRNLRAGDVLLLHDASSATAASGRPVAFETLPLLLDALENAGLRAVPLPATAGA